MISIIEGAHLTATDRRNITALLDHDGFEFGRTFKIGRKTYSIADGTDRLEVTIVEPDTDDYGRRIHRTYRTMIRKAIYNEAVTVVDGFVVSDYDDNPRDWDFLT